MEHTGIKPFLHVRNASNPVYHPKKDQISFITNFTGIPQVWELEKNQGWPSQTTFTSERIIFADYVSGTTKRVIGMDEGVNEKQQLYLLKENGRITPLTSSPDHIHHYGGSSPDGKWIAWSSNRRQRAFFDIYIQNLETLEIRPILTGEHTYSVLKWHPNGSTLLIRRTNSNLDHDLGLLSVQSGEVSWLTEHEGEACFFSPHFSSDGKSIYVLSNKDREYVGLAAINLENLTMSWLDVRDWDLEELQMNAEGTTLAYTVNEGGISKGTIFQMADQQVSSWESPKGVISEISFSPDGTKLAFVLNGALHPSDIWELDIQSGVSERLTFVSKSPVVEEHLVEPELIYFKTFDEREIPAFYYRPKNTEGQKLPVVVFVHGGPESQFKSVYNPFLQYFLSRGYAVCAPNVRGSTGYGKTYTHLDDVRKRMDSVNDLVYLAEWLKQEGEADTNKIAIMGRSYGGFMVLAAVTHYPKLWSAAIDIVGISSFRTFLEKTSIWRRKLREAEYGSIEENGDFFDQIDPIHHIDRISAPLMVLHGANDPRVPIEETEQIVSALKKRNHPVSYIRFEDEGHFFVKLNNNITAYTAAADFLDQYIGK